MEFKQQHQGIKMLNISVLGMVLALAGSGCAIIAVLAIKISSKRTPHYELNKYD
jgi:hypothetical protein